MQAKEFSIPVRVYIEDTDVGGIVYYVNYLKFMERARTDMLRSIGYKETDAHEDYQFVVHSCQINYRAPARMDDLLTVTARIVRKGKAYFLFEQKVLSGENSDSPGTVMCEAEIKVACLDPVDMKPAAIPRQLLDDLASGDYL